MGRSVVPSSRCAGTGSSLLATDVLWSDPVGEPGLAANDARGVGLTFGPDVTQVAAHAGGKGEGRARAHALGRGQGCAWDGLYAAAARARAVRRYHVCGLRGPRGPQAFLAANGLRLILRSHEGPDARDKRSDLPQVGGRRLAHGPPTALRAACPLQQRLQSAWRVQRPAVGPRALFSGGGRAWCSALAATRCV